MPLAPRPAELAHRHHVLEPDLRARSQRRPPLPAATVNEPQLEPGTNGLHLWVPTTCVTRADALPSAVSRPVPGEPVLVRPDVG